MLVQKILNSFQTQEFVIECLKGMKIKHFNDTDKRIEIYSPNNNLDGGVPFAPSYDVNISQLIRLARVAYFSAHNKTLTAKFLQQGYWY